MAVKAQVLVSVNWKTRHPLATKVAVLWLTLLALVFIQFLPHFGPLEPSFNFLVSLATHLQECLLHMSSMSNCCVVGSFQVMISSILPEIKCLQSNVNGIERDQQWVPFLTLNRKSKALAKSWISVFEVRWGEFLYGMVCITPGRSSWWGISYILLQGSWVCCLDHQTESLNLHWSYFLLGEWRFLLTTTSLSVWGSDPLGGLVLSSLLSCGFSLTECFE